MSLSQLLNWEAYDQVQPIGTLAHNYFSAAIVATLVNIYRDRKKFPDLFPTEMFLTEFDQPTRTGAAAPPRKPTQRDWRELKAIGRNLAAMYNEEQKPRSKRKRHG